MKKKILHLIHDDKFINEAIDVFEEHNNAIDNTFLCISYSPIPDAMFKHIRRSKNVIQLYHKSLEYISLISQPFDAIIIHYFLEQYYNKVQYFYKKTKVFYFAWGGDFYGNIEYPTYQEKTKLFFLDEIEANKQFANSVSIVPQNTFPETTIFSTQYFRLLYRYFRKKICLYKHEKSYVFQQAIQRVDYCATVLPQEFSILQRATQFKAKQVLFNYPLQQDVFQLENISKENRILINNSEAIENNHIDVIDALELMHLAEFLYMCPLSYGHDSADKIEQYGTQKLGANFKAIRNFIPFSEYEELLASCKVGIFNANRQMSLGNINIMLFYGAKVFLSELSPVYKSMKEKGIIVFSVQKDLSEEEIITKLSIEQQQHNASIIYADFNHANSSMIKDLLIHI